MRLNKDYIFSEKELKKEIMNTNVYVLISSNEFSKAEMDEDIEHCFNMFRDFEKKFSRFLETSELSKFNQGRITSIDNDFDQMIETAQKWRIKTNGLFDIGILPLLKNEGYTKSMAEIESIIQDEPKKVHQFKSIQFLTKDTDTGEYKKPKDLSIDLGGIGKGFIVDKVSKWLHEKYADFIVDAGGDIFFAGENKVSKLNYWESYIENPKTKEGSIQTLKLKNKGVATSGTNRRQWIQNNEQKHHIIDPITNQSAITDLLTVTVIAESASQADILAKTLLIMGSKNGIEYSKLNHISAFFIKNDMKTEKVNFSQYI